MLRTLFWYRLCKIEIELLMKQTFVCVMITWGDCIMYDYIKGKMAYRALEYVVLDHQGIGYKIMTSNHTADQCTVGEEVTLYTEMIVREDYMGICGFYTREELKVFQLLTSISGIGMKAGLSVLSKIVYTDLSKAIMMGDVKSLQKAPGIGTKTAQRIVLELKDKLSKVLDNMPLPLEMAAENHRNMGQQENLKDAMEAMEQLGYRTSDVEKLFASMGNPNGTVEDLIKQALAMVSIS